MKQILLGVGTILFALSMSADAQMRGGRGPHAWGDKNGDGKCDMTGRTTGQGRGRGMAAMRGGGGGQGQCQRNGACPRGQGVAAQPTPAPQQKK